MSPLRHRSHFPKADNTQRRFRQNWPSQVRPCRDIRNGGDPESKTLANSFADSVCVIPRVITDETHLGDALDQPIGKIARWSRVAMATAQFQMSVGINQP